MITAEKVDVLIVGAGLSGLLAAKTLHSLGARVRIVDKGRGVGGRMATRRLGVGVFDHGAQYFTFDDPRFGAFVEEWKLSGIVQPWAAGFRLQDGTLKSDGRTRFSGMTGMTGVAKHLALGLDVHLDTRIVRLELQDDSWLTTTVAGDRFLSRALLLTPPVPQSLALLASSDAPLPENVEEDLKRISYAPCLALLALLDGPSALPEPGGLWLSGEPLSWMADNHQKGISKDDHAAITLHAGPKYSEEKWDFPADEITATLLEIARPWLGSSVLQNQLHRWRYSIPKETHDERCIVAEMPAPLVFAGDAFGGPRVEGAALSGLAAGHALAKILHLDPV